MSKDNHRESEWENDLPAKSHREGETRCHGGQGCRAEPGPATESLLGECIHGPSVRAALL